MNFDLECFSELTPEQRTDLEILMNLDTPEKIQEWMEAVGFDDVDYGLALLETAAIAMLDESQSDDDSSMQIAQDLIQRARQS